MGNGAELGSQRPGCLSCGITPETPLFLRAPILLEELLIEGWCGKGERAIRGRHDLTLDGLWKKPTKPNKEQGLEL